MKRIIAKLISASIILSILVSVFTATAFATQSNYQKFDTDGFVSSGNPGRDMAAIALAQTGKTGSELNYSEEWCADFVGDCAIIVGQSSAVPLYGSVEGLYTRLIDAKASTVAEKPEAGDLVFINWEGEERLAHVEIVYDYDASTGTVYTVGGNTGSYDTCYDRRVSTHEISLSSDEVKGILRPSYCAEHTYTFFNCSECGALRPELAKIVSILRSFIYSIKNMLDNFSVNI